jgi:hypothetical protein
MKIHSKREFNCMQVQQTKFQKDFPHWHICESCAFKRGAEWGKDGGIGITVVRGICKYCKQEHLTLIPLSDFEWPEYKRKAIF